MGHTYVHESLPTLDVQHATDQWPHHHVIVSTNDTPHSTLYTPSGKAKVLLEILNGLLFNLCVCHSFKKQSPGGRLEAFATTPFAEPFLHCFFLLLAMGSIACSDCGCIKPHSFKGCFPLVSCFSAYANSE